MPQSSIEQPVSMVPHWAPAWAQLFVGWHSHAFEALQTSPAPQVPQSKVPPHPSGVEPQLAERLAQVSGTHSQMLSEHTSPAPQLPHWTVPPQPESIAPHSAPALLQLAGAQALSGGMQTEIALGSFGLVRTQLSDAGQPVLVRSGSQVMRQAEVNDGLFETVRQVARVPLMFRQAPSGH